MKRALTLLAMLALVGSAFASVPDPDYSTVDPMDQMDIPRVLGIPHDTRDDPTCVDAAEMDIHIAAYGGEQIENAYVEVIFNGLCDALCLCASYVSTGYTDSNGDLTICCRFGGCCETPSAAIIMAEGVGIRSTDYIVSPDFDGESGNCAVDLSDFIYFSNYWGQVGGVTCADFSGDGNCDLSDFIPFAGAWGRSCVPE